MTTRTEYKAARVLVSCETAEQLEVAREYERLAGNISTTSRAYRLGLKHGATFRKRRLLPIHKIRRKEA